MLFLLLYCHVPAPHGGARRIIFIVVRVDHGKGVYPSIFLSGNVFNCYQETKL